MLLVGDGVALGLAVANGLGVDEKPPKPMARESAAIAMSAMMAPIAPREKVGFGSTFWAILGPFGRLVLPPLR